tara:strand:- start:751 stop:897 length:147 start_codon:yes stop_codon:yes gene_type:complete
MESKKIIQHLERSNKVLEKKNQILMEDLKIMESTVETLLSYAKEKWKN